MTLDEQAILRLNDLLREAGRRIVIVSHTNPDGDAVGSSLAWAEILRGMGHRVLCVVPNKYPYFLDWMTGIEEVVVYKTDTEGRAARAVEEADLIFCLDFNAISRLENLSDVIESNTTARRVLIDHHLAPDPGFELMFSHPDASSTSFIVYKIIERLCGTGAITPAMAEAMYVGMMTDTGNFSFSFLTPDLYRAVAVLAETGIDLPQIHNNVYNAFTEGRARLFGYAINRKMEIIQDGTVAYMSLLESEMRRFQFQQGDSEGFVNYALTIKKVKNVGHVRGAPQVHPHLAALARRRGREPLRPQILQRRRPPQCGRRQVVRYDAANHRPLRAFGRGVRPRRLPGLIWTISGFGFLSLRPSRSASRDAPSSSTSRSRP